MQEETTTVSTRYRRLPWPWEVVSVVFPAIAMVLAVIYIFHLRPFGVNLIDKQYLYLLVSLLIPLVFVWIPINQRAPRDRVPWYDVLFFVITFVIPAYFSTQVVEMIHTGWGHVAPQHALVLSFILWMLVLEMSRRAGGNFFGAVVAVISVYPFFAWAMPGPLVAQPFSLLRVGSFLMFSDDGFVGVPVQVLGRLFLAYMVLAVALDVSGAGRLFTDLAGRFIGNVRGCNAKVACVSSGLFGTISGSPISNVFTTGVFTIPAMKNDGMDPAMAGGVEAVAATGGAVMPPIMGAAAFIMAEFLGVSYATIALGAAIPSVMYYLTLFMEIDAYAATKGIKGKRVAQAKPIGRMLLEHYHLVVAFLVLLYILFFLRLETWAPWLATGGMFAVGLLKKQTRLTPRMLRELVQGVGKMVGEVSGIMAGVGLIVGALVLTGIAYSIPYQMVSLARGNLYLIIVIAAIAAYVLGMGVPIAASYILLSMTVAPALVNAGVQLLPAHFFVMFCALWSFLSPPVALSAFAAAILAGADPMKCGLKAMRLGIVIFFLPFFIVFQPGLILQGTPLEILRATALCLLGFVFIAGPLEGYLWGIGRINMVSRILFIIGGTMIAIPEANSELWGGILVAVLLGVHLLRKTLMKRAIPDSIGAEEKSH